MTDKSDDHKPLVGWMILEDYCEDMSRWDGVITYPDPTGANLAWQNPTKMIEFSAYAALQARLAAAEAERDKLLCGDLYKHWEKQNIELRAENRRLNLICEQEFGRADSVGELVKQNADLLQWADRLTKFISDAQCECSVAERDSGHLVGCWRPDLDSLLIEFHQWRGKSET